MAKGTIVFVDMGQMHHNGGTNYFSWTAFTPEGKSHALATIDMINTVLVQEGLVAAEAVRAAEAATDAEAIAYAEARVAEAAAVKAEQAKQKQRKAG